jgi:endonuclease YncB( thermonuclease family)
MPAIAVPATYAALRREVEAIVVKGRNEIDRAWVRTYHETGRLITEHLLQNKERANYGGQVFNRLAEDTGISKRTLHECAQFARCFPIVRPVAQLSWNHYRLLCQVPNAAHRAALLKETLKTGLSSPQLMERVRALSASATATVDLTVAPTVEPPKPLIPKRGPPGICKVITAGERLAVDLGFAIYLDLPADTKLKLGNCVQLNAADFPSPHAPLATLIPSYTYAASVIKVVDGDTLWVQVYLDARRWVKQKLRLRDLDCPEVDTAEGKTAKRFVESLIARTTAVTICTTKPDKYDRYLADVFLTLTDGSDVFLNNTLLQNGHAVVKRAWQFEDWGE